MRFLVRKLLKKRRGTRDGLPLVDIPPNRRARADQTSRSMHITHLVSPNSSRDLNRRSPVFEVRMLQPRASNARTRFGMVRPRSSASSQLHHHQIRSLFESQNNSPKCSNSPRRVPRHVLLSGPSRHPRSRKQHGQRQGVIQHCPESDDKPSVMDTDTGMGANVNTDATCPASTSLRSRIRPLLYDLTRVPREKRRSPHGHHVGPSPCSYTRRLLQCMAISGMHALGRRRSWGRRRRSCTRLPRRGLSRGRARLQMGSVSLCRRPCR